MKWFLNSLKDQIIFKTLRETVQYSFCSLAERLYPYKLKHYRQLFAIERQVSYEPRGKFQVPKEPCFYIILHLKF